MTASECDRLEQAAEEALATGLRLLAERARDGAPVRSGLSYVAHARDLFRRVAAGRRGNPAARRRPRRTWR